MERREKNQSVELRKDFLKIENGYIFFKDGSKRKMSLEEEKDNKYKGGFKGANLEK